MQIDLIAVGKRMPDWIDAAINEYKKRLPAHLNFSIKEITPADRKRKNSIEQYRHQEEERLMSAIKPDSLLIMLDEHGKQFDSNAFANKLGDWIDHNQTVSLIIGGADGFSSAFKKKSHLLWSLSALTFPHGLARVLVAEQVYRAWTILNKHPYHRE